VDDESGQPQHLGTTSELVDLVDDDDQVIGTVTRAEMRSKRLLHRAVFIAVVATDGRVLIHRRADTKDVWPGMWDLAAGGVVTAGETYESAARRELGEELGVNEAKIVHLGDGRFSDNSVTLLGRCFRATHDGPFRFTDGEITEVEWIDRAELDRLVATRPFVPDSVALILPLLR
jgi:isopentenyldiphosphate isomerase